MNTQRPHPPDAPSPAGTGGGNANADRPGNGAAYLVLQSAGRWSDVFRLIPPSEAFIGRASANQIVVRSDQASRRHARIFWSGEGWRIEDLGSRNGTFVGDRRIDDTQPLCDGDEIRIAGFAIHFTHRIDNRLGSAAGSIALPHSEPQSRTEDQITMELDARSITDRRRHSDYLHGGRSASTISSESVDSQTPIRGHLLKLAFTLAAIEDVDAGIATVLDLLLQQRSVDTAAVYIWDQDEQVPEVREIPLVATRQSGTRSYRRPPEPLLQSLAGENGNALLARNIVGDERLATENSQGQIDVESIILAPIRDHHDRTLGLVHLTTAAGQRPLDSDDLQFVVATTEILAESVLRLSQQQQLARSLQQSRRRVQLLQQQLGDKVRIVGKSEAIRGVIEKISMAAPTNATVLIRGESGVGKELVASALHHTSSRKNAPLVCLNCAAISASLLESELFGHEKGAFTGATERKLGKFEMADGGTLMLDEIGEMNSELQAKLLRVLEGHSFERVGGQQPVRTDVRLIAATNRDLQAMVQEGTFRQDLYYRLHVIEINVPPLRQRQQDCLLLARFFLDRFNREMGRRIEGFTAAAQQKLLAYHWPGNIRELRNVIERAVVLNQKSMIDADDLLLSPAESGKRAELDSGPADVEISLAALERQHIERILRHTDGNKSRAAAILGIERSTLDRKLKKFAD